MKVCPLCGDTLLDDARFCPGDGSLLVTATDPHIGKLLLGQFEVREVCGRGSMGTVYKAWQTSMDREVAIKVLRRDLMKDSNILKRFHREARAAARLSHPNIITVFMVGDTDDGVPFLVMEYVKGHSLARICEADGPLPAVRAVHIARQITSALTEAHDQDVVHRDLKPENILLSNKPQSPDFVTVLDFGIAKIVRGDEESQLTQTGAIFGTPHYLAPEQASGGDVDHRADLYALGVILFEVVVGRLPFPSESGMAVLVQHIKEPPPRPRDLKHSIPQPLEDVILKALEKDPGDRFQSAGEFSEALGRVVDKLQFGAQTLLRVSTDAGVTPQVETAHSSESRAAVRGRTIPSTMDLRPPARPTELPTPAEHHDTDVDELKAHDADPAAEQQPGPQPDRAPPLAQTDPKPQPATGAEPDSGAASTPSDLDQPGADQQHEVEESAQKEELGPAPDDTAAAEQPASAQENEPEAPRVAPSTDTEAADDLVVVPEAHGELDSPGQSTVRMFNSMMGRRRFLKHAVAGLVTMSSGAAAGALYWNKKQDGEPASEPPVEHQPPPVPQHKPDPPEVKPAHSEEQPGPAPAPDPGATKKKPQAVPKRRGKKRRKSTRARRPAVAKQPVAAKPPVATKQPVPTKKTAPTRKSTTVAPVGPDPVKGSDHHQGGDDHGDHTPPAKPAPARKKPAPAKSRPRPKKPAPRPSIKKTDDLYELVD